MKKSELIELIKEVLNEAQAKHPIGVSYSSPMYFGQPAIHIGNGVYIPISQQQNRYPQGQSRPATPEEEMFGYVAVILAGAAVLAVAAPEVWGKIKGKYNRFKTDIENKKLGQTVSVNDLADEIEAAAGTLSPKTKKTVMKWFDEAKSAQTPKELGEKIKKIRNHIQQYGAQAE